VIPTAVSIDSECHHPRRRVIQYSHRFEFALRRMWLLDAPRSRSMTGQELLRLV
jgi:hypothetical protein